MLLKDLNLKNADSSFFSAEPTRRNSDEQSEDNFEPDRKSFDRKSDQRKRKRFHDSRVSQFYEIFETVKELLS